MKRNINNTVRKVKQIQHDENVMKYRLEGYSYQEIGGIVAELEGRNTPYTKQAMWKSVQKNLKQIEQKSNDVIEHHREIQLLRLEKLMTQAFKMATEEKSLHAIDRCLKIMERQSKLLCLDVHARTDNIDQGEDTPNIVFYVPDNGRGPDSQNNVIHSN